MPLYSSTSSIDSVFRIRDDADPTKQMAFQVSGVSTGTTRTYTAPNSDGTLAILDLAQTFTAAQGITLATSGANPLTLTSTNADNIAGPIMGFDRNSASPVAGDSIGAFQFTGRNTSAGQIAYCYIAGTIADSTAASEDGRLDFNIYVAGTLTPCMQVGAGIVAGAPTGGDKGTGTVNATAVYDDNVLLTCAPIERVRTGAMSVDKWDDLVPDRVVPEFRYHVKVMEEFDEPALEKTDGGFVVTTRRSQRQVVDLMPVWDQGGNGLGAVEQPVFEEVVRPATVEPRYHEVVRLYQRMVEEGYRDDAESFVDRMMADGAVPGLIRPDEWSEETRPTIGGGITRTWLAIDLMALAIKDLTERLKRLEAATKG